VTVIPAEAGIQKPYDLVRPLKYRLFLTGIIIGYSESVKYILPLETAVYYAKR